VIVFRDSVRSRVRNRHERRGRMISEGALAGSATLACSGRAKEQKCPQSCDARTVQQPARYRLSAHRPRVPGDRPHCGPEKHRSAVTRPHTESVDRGAYRGRRRRRGKHRLPGVRTSPNGATVWTDHCEAPRREREERRRGSKNDHVSSTSARDHPIKRTWGGLYDISVPAEPRNQSERGRQGRCYSRQVAGLTIGCVWGNR
jgi:hypothetical protein